MEQASCEAPSEIMHMHRIYQFSSYRWGDTER